MADEPDWVPPGVDTGRANTARVWATMGDGKDAMAIIDDIPEGHKLLGVT